MFDIPAITRPVPLSEYHEKLEDGLLEMWVNIPRAKRVEYNDLRRDMLNTFDELRKTDAAKRPELVEKVNELTAAHYGYWAVMFNQAGAEYTAEDIQELAEKDGAFWQWLMDRCWKLIDEWRDEAKKKAQAKPSQSPPED